MNDRATCEYAQHAQDVVTCKLCTQSASVLTTVVSSGYCAASLAVVQLSQRGSGGGMADLGAMTC